MKIHLHIDRVVLEGLPVDRPHVIRRVLQRELGARLMEEGLSPDLLANRSMRSIRSASISFSRASDPALLGGNIARAVSRGIGAGTARTRPVMRAGVNGGAQ